MLYPYKYIPHEIEKMQEFIDFIFFEVWCKAPEGKPFSLELFATNAELCKVIEIFYFTDLEYTDNKDKYKTQPTASKFYVKTLNIYSLFSALNKRQINQFKQWYKANNNIEKVCANDPSIHILRYSDIKAAYPDLSKHLASFFKELYANELLSLAAWREKIGEVDNHYRKFMNTNRSHICPFCGISIMLSIYHSKREAYDHYLPKGIYPFNSINFRNLVPACHHCNSNYKLSQDPAFKPKDPVGISRRRKLFYPYSASIDKIEVSIDLSGLDDLNKLDDKHLEPSDIKLSFGPTTINEEIESWKDIYGIEERYVAQCCGSAKYWLEEMRIACERNGTEPKDELDEKRELFEKYPLQDSNFLRVAFLEGCYRIGIWNSSL